MRADEQLRELEEQQHGLVTRDQCRAAGLSRKMIAVRLARGDWVEVSRRVLRRAGSPPTAHATLLAAVLDAGAAAVASHRSAAALWRLPGFALSDIDVSRLHGSEHARVYLGRLHHPRSLPPHHCTTVDGIPVTTPARTIFDLAGLVSPHRTERALDNAVSASPTLLLALHRMLPELAERGRNGISVMRELLADRPAGYIAPASGLEARVVRLLADAGIKARRQVDLGGDDWIGRVDLLIEGANLVIEVDSARFHSSLSDCRRDEARDDALRALGCHVLRLHEEDVWARPSDVVRQVRAALRRAA